MPSLPWILLLALAVLHNLMAAPIIENSDRSRLQHYSEKIIDKIKTMKKHTCPDTSATFYSPPGDLIDCIKADLKCYSEELQIVKHECLGTPQDESLLNASDDIKEQLDRMNKIFEKASQFQSMDCPCEIHPPKSYEEFLLSLEQRIQKMNSQLYSTTSHPKGT